MSTERPFRVGDRIIEKHPISESRVIEELVPGHYVIAQGFKRTRISWSRLGRYRLVDEQDARR